MFRGPDIAIRADGQVDAPEPTIVVGVNLPLTNFGKPFTAKVTIPENPAPGVIVTAYLLLPPLLIVVLGGVTLRENVPGTTSVTFAVRARVPLVPVTVIW